MKLVAFCESRADFRVASDLIDRVLREAGPRWVGDVMDVAEEGIREFCEDDEGHTFFDIHKIDEYAARTSIRRAYGHFGDRPGAAGALMARTAFRIVRSLAKVRGHIDAAILVWDMDNQPDERRAGLAQARLEAQAIEQFRVVLGCPNAMREAWVLIGFDPQGGDERAALEVLRRELGFWPNEDAHLLTARDEQARRSAKRVLRILTRDDPSREERCWTETPLEILDRRGELTGLRDFLTEVKQELVPLCGQP